jgi:HEAT repeat protein
MGKTKSRLALILALSFALPGLAEGAKPKPKAEEGQLSLEEIAVMLSSGDADEVRMAIEGAASLGSKDVVPLLSERIKAGLPPDLLRSAVDSLMLVGDASTLEVFTLLSSHRTEPIRLSAVEALGSLKAPGAVDALLKALSDGSSPIREAAAHGLGEQGSRAALPALFKAFDRDVRSAAGALGKLAGPDELSRLLDYLGRVPFTNLSPAFDAFMARRDVSEALQLRVVVQLTEVGTGEARGYLERLYKELPPDTKPRVRRAIEDAVVRIAQ